MCFEKVPELEAFVTRKEERLNMGSRNLLQTVKINVLSVLKISFTGCPGPSLVISEQFTLENSRQKITKTRF